MTTDTQLAPTDAEIKDLYAQETGFILDESPAALLDFARAVLTKWGQPAHSGEPVAWQYRSLRDNGAWFDCTKERFEMRCTQPEIWETRALYAAPPTSAEGVEHG